MNENFLKNVLSTSVESQQKLAVSTQKIKLIAEAIAERFDGDGIDDINLPKKINVWTIVTNAGSIVKLIRSIIEIIKTEVKIPIIDQDRLLAETKIAEGMYLNTFNNQIEENESVVVKENIV